MEGRSSTSLMTDNIDILSHYEEECFEEELVRGTANVRAFFSGDYATAYGRTRQHHGQTLYDTYLGTIFLFIKAMLSFDPLDIQECLKGFEESVEMARRIKHSISPPWFTWHTNEDGRGKRMQEKNPRLLRHAELVIAEALMIRAALLVGTDEGGGWQLLIREVLHLRQSYQFYRRNHDEGAGVDAEYMAGVQLGLGFFASLFAFLPPRIAKIFEILGYYETESGMTHFMRCVDGPRCARGVFCEAIVMMLRLCITPVLMGNELARRMEDDTMEGARRVLVSAMQTHPECSMTKYFEGRWHFLEGQLEASKRVHMEIIKTVDDWLPIRNAALWEGLQVACAECDWECAAHHCGSLVGSSRWSPAFFTYAQGVFEWASGKSDYACTRELLRTVPGAMKRIAGQSVPFEKFGGGVWSIWRSINCRSSPTSS